MSGSGDHIRRTHETLFEEGDVVEIRGLQRPAFDLVQVAQKSVGCGSLGAEALKATWLDSGSQNPSSVIEGPLATSALEIPSR